jgi:uncharacterized protein
VAAVTEYEYEGPKRGADRAVLLAHGAGADMRSATMTTVTDALAQAKIPSLRFNFPYRSAGRRAPDRPAALEAAVREAAAELAARAKLPRDRLVVGGRSMGGRICSMIAAEDGALGVVLLGYPLHPPGKPATLRVGHFPSLRVPVLFASGTRDAFGTPAELERHAEKIHGPVTFHWIETADHGFKPLKSSGITQADALAGVAAAVVAFVRRFPAAK